MTSPQRLCTPTGTANLKWMLTDDGSHTLFASNLDESFHSGSGAVAETLIVYLLNSGVADRLREHRPTAVLEYGLGTATGFLLTAAMAEFYRSKLVYYALEKSLLPVAIFRALDLPNSLEKSLASGRAQSTSGNSPFTCDQFSPLPFLTKAFCEGVSELTDLGDIRTHRLELSEFAELTLVVGDARSFHPARNNPARDRLFDAVYFDPFSPETNPELWTSTVFEQAAAALRPGGRLASYCVKSSVRRMIEAAGLRAERVAGPVGGKREVLVATKEFNRV